MWDATYEWPDGRKGGYTDGSIDYVLLLDSVATKEKIIMAMNKVYSKAKEDDIVIFFFSGHGFNGGFCAYDGIHTYLVRKALYAGMTNDSIFKYVVDYLMKMGESSHTNYVLANMYVYILPFLLILIVGLIGWMIYRFTRRVPMTKTVD
ncbi:MAG: caspase family protein [Muribaculaceae bacterium]|nr:caspase family protein [Muribaculaceae bacterium]